MDKGRVNLSDRGCVVKLYNTVVRNWHQMNQSSVALISRQILVSDQIKCIVHKKHIILSCDGNKTVHLWAKLQVDQFISSLMTASLGNFCSFIENIRFSRLCVHLHLLVNADLTVAPFWHVWLRCKNILPIDFRCKVKPICPHKRG